MAALQQLSVFLLVVASPLSSAQCNNDAFRLHPIPRGEINEGMVQRCVSQNWRAVCGTSWDCKDARVVCRQLGFAVSNALATTLSLSTIPWSPRDSTRYSCSGIENSLTNCPSTTISCSFTAARALCQVENLCSQGDLRLVGGDTDSGSGRLELCYGGKWNHFCGLGYNEAATACRILGFSEYPRIITDERYGRSNSSYRLFSGVSCSVHGNESSLADCTLSSTSTCTYTTTTSPCTQTGLQCYNPPTQACQEGSVRLVNGTIEQEGRVEVCIGGLWGSMCYSTWNNPSANRFVVCNQLGHRSSSQLFSPLQAVSLFGAGSGPVFRGFKCEGWEQNIGQCYNRTIQYSPLSSGSCNWNDIVGVRCNDYCINGNVRLIGGPNNSSGIVQVCYNSLWGLIAEPGWSDANAAVVCRQLQLSDEGAVAVNFTRVGFRKPKEAIHWSNVHCQGQESGLSQCSSYKHSLSVAIGLMNKLEVAGVSCQPNVPTIEKLLMTNTSTTVFTALTFVLLLAVLLLAVGFAVYYCRNKPKEQRDTALSAVVGKQAGEIYDDDVYETPAGVNM